MKKVYIHAGLIFYDLLSILALYLFFQNYIEIDTALKTCADTIEYMSKSPFAMFGFFVPALHLYVIAKKKIPGLKKIEAKFFITIVVGVLTLSLFVGFHMSNKFISHGYVKCEMVIPNKFQTLYARNIVVCIKLHESY